MKNHSHAKPNEAKTANNQSSLINNHLKGKPNFKNTKNSVSLFKTSKYEILSAWRSKEQTQYKADSNPTCFNTIIALSSFMTSKYENVGCQQAKKTNPIQTQSKAKIVNNQLSLIDNHLTKGTVEVVNLESKIGDYGKVIYFIKADSK